MDEGRQKKTYEGARRRRYGIVFERRLNGVGRRETNDRGAVPPTMRIRAERTSVHDVTEVAARRLDGRGVVVVGGVLAVVGCWPSTARTPSP